MSLLNMSLTSAVLILAVLAIRIATLHRLPKQTFVALWWLVLARLLIPFRVPSVFSIYTLWNRLRPKRAISAILPVTYSDATHTVLPTHPVVVQESSVYQLAGALSPWALVWLIGMVVCLAIFAGLYLHWRGIFRVSLPTENEVVARWLREHPVRRRITIRQSDRIHTPLTYGLFRPVILLPKTLKLADGRKLEFVLTHEYVHICRLDALTKLLLALAVCVHWFNPIVWLMALFCNRDIELACDEQVLSILGETARSDYALILIQLAEKKSYSLPFVNGIGGNSVEERIRSIMKSRKNSLAAVIAAILLVMGVATAFATSSPNDNTSQAVTIYSLVSDEVQSRQSFLVDHADFSKESELLYSYEEYGVSYDDVGNIYYNGQPVRWLWDGCDVMENGVVIGQSIRYEYLNKEGTVDVHVVRDLEYDADDSIWNNGITGIEPYSQEEFDALDVDELLKTYAQTSVALEVSDDYMTSEESAGTVEVNGDNITEAFLAEASSVEQASYDEISESEGENVAADGEVSIAEMASDSLEQGVTFVEYFSRFAPYGIRYQEAEGINGTLRQLYWNEIPVSKFIDIGPHGTTTFGFDVENGIGVTIRSVYSDEELVGVKAVD